MAKIEDLIGQIPDERLKKAIGAEVRELKKNKKFGLVFEEHLPETVRLPNLPVKEGELVAEKREAGNELWRVKSIRNGVAILERPVEGYRTVRDGRQSAGSGAGCCPQLWRSNLSCAGAGGPRGAGRAGQALAHAHQCRQLPRPPATPLCL